MRLAHKQRGFVAPAAAALGISPLIVWGIMAAIVVAALAFLAWQIDSRGYDRAKGKYEPQVRAAQVERDILRTERNQVIASNARLVKSFEDLRRTYEESQAALEALKAEQAAAELALRKALVKVVEQEKRYSAEIKRLAAIAAGPVITEGVLDETDAILRTLARDRTHRMR